MPYLYLRTKLIFVLSLILLSGFFITNVISYRASKRQIHSSIVESSLPLARDNVYSEIQRDLTRPIFVSSLMANDTFLKDWVTGGEKQIQQIIRYLTEIKEKYGFFSSFFVSDISHNYYHFKGILKQIHPDDSHDDWYYNFKNKNMEYDLDVDTNEAEQNHLTIFINHRLTDDNGQFIGVVGVGLDFDRVASLLDGYKARYNRNIYMVSPDGVIQIHTDKSKILTTSIFELPGLKQIAQDILAAKDEPDFFEYDDAGGSHILLTSRFVEELDWYLLVEQDETLALKSIQTTFMQNFFISLGITFITILFVILVINYFQKRLETMATTDKLTKAYNRREFERRFHFYTSANRRESMNMSIILFDIDLLKELNDTLGHLAGDKIISGIAHLAGRTIRDNDMLVRWGGDEFVILTFTGTDKAVSIARRLQQAIHDHAFLDSRPGKKQTVTISCGIAGYRVDDTLDTLLGRADKALYKAKNKGRNCIVTAGQTPGEDG